MFSPTVRMQLLLPIPQDTAPFHQVSPGEPTLGIFHHMLFCLQHQNNWWWSFSDEWVVTPDLLSYSKSLCWVHQIGNPLCLHRLLQLLSSESGVLFLEDDPFSSVNEGSQQAKIFLYEFFFWSQINFIRFHHLLGADLWRAFLP